LAKKTVGYTELFWNCPSCGTKNPGSSQTCVSCGAHQPHEVNFEQSADQALLEDEAKIKAARQAPDVHCPYCGTRNSAEAEVCIHCGGSLKDGQRRVVGRILGAFGQPGTTSTDIACPSCHQPNAPSAAFCVHCGAPLTKPTAPQPQSLPAAATTKKPVKISPFLIILAALLGIGCIVVVLIAILSGGGSQAVVGTVTSLYWERKIQILEQQPVRRESWRPEIPSDAAIIDCKEELYSVQTDPVAGALEVCGTPYTVDLGTGYAEVVQDCEYHVYEDLCTYTIDEWVVADTIMSSGNDSYTYWPTLDLQEGQKTGEQTEGYLIILQADGEQYEYRTNDMTLFSRAAVGTQWEIQTGIFGAVNSLVPVQ